MYFTIKYNIFSLYEYLSKLLGIFYILNPIA